MEVLQARLHAVQSVFNIDFLRHDFLRRFSGERVSIASGWQTIDAVFLGSPQCRHVVIFCNPNAGVVEFMGQSSSGWVSFYRERGIGMMLYNYRGYGRSSGSPTPAALRRDAAEVAKWVLARCPESRIIVHGESMGGMLAAHLANVRELVPRIDLLVCDRTFRDLESAGAELLAHWIKPAMKWLVFWDSDNTQAFLKARCKKICMADPNDSMIADCASLKAGVAESIILDNDGNDGNELQGFKYKIWADEDDCRRLVDAIGLLVHAVQTRGAPLAQLHAITFMVQAVRM